MPCSEEEALVRFFYNVSASFLLLFLFLRLSSALLSGILDYIATFSLFRRNQPDCEYGSYFEDEDVEGEEEEVEEGEPLLSHGCFQVGSMGETDLIADIIHGGEALSFLHTADNLYEIHEAPFSEGLGYSKEAVPTEEAEEGQSSEQLSARDDSLGREWDQESIEDNKDEEIPEEDCDSAHSVDSTDDGPPTPVMLDRFRNEIAKDIPVYDEITETKEETNNVTRGNGRLITNTAQEVDAKNFQGRIENDFEEIFGDSCTVGSTSKSSSEWRSSTINCRDSGTEDPFSSSSRRSCPKWESYTVFQKYDEEMMFLDQISAQKLQETESLRSFKVKPRSISERIVHKITTESKRKPADFRNPYHELEAAYVAEICLTWEALNWNYKNFQSKRTSKARDDIDPGCPARMAQQFQQFQVLLQRYVENEPYEQGRRPEIYARMRLLAPKLLQVPEYREYEDDADQKEEGFGSRISSPAFLMIMEDGIQTYMNFLKADKVKPCQVIASFFSKKRRGSVDPTLLALMKKVNKKKKIKLKELRRAGRCIRKRKLKVEEEMGILMALIDLKVVSRVLRMGDLSEEQLHWCEAKMSKVRVAHGKLQRDFTPLFFPAH